MLKASPLGAIVPVVLVMVAAGCTSMTSRYEKDMAEARAAHIYACHGFDCRRKTRVPINAAAQARMASIMADGAASPEAERGAIKRAVAYYESLTTVRSASPTSRSPTLPRRRNRADGLHRRVERIRGLCCATSMPVVS